MKTLSSETISRLPASRFPEPAELYFCDNCGRDLTRNLYRDRGSVWQPLRPMWYLCECGRKYLSGAAEWDDLSTWEREKRAWQLQIGFVLFALLVIPTTLAYFALRYGGAALFVIVGIALIPSILVAKPFWFVLLDVYEIIASIWRTRIAERKTSSAGTFSQRILRFRPAKFGLTSVAAAIALLIVAARWTPSHLVAASPMTALSSPERSSSAGQETLPVLSEPPSPLKSQAATDGAPSSAFRRVQVGPDEIDYVAEDVTIRHFASTFVLPRARSTYRPACKEVQFGDDVTMRYFSYQPEFARRVHPVSLNRSLPLPN